MAIQGNYTLNDQVLITNAYIKVLDVRGGKQGLACSIGVFANQAAADGGSTPLAVIQGPSFAYMSGQDFLSLAYDAVKQLAEWSGFTNC